MSSLASEPETDYRKRKRHCCVVFDYAVFAGLHSLGAYYLYGLICYQDAMANAALANSTLTQSIDPEYFTLMVCCIYSMLLPFMIYACKQYTRHAFGVCLACLVLATIFLNVLVARMMNYSCKYRLLLTCYGDDADHDLNNSALDSAHSLLGTASGIAAGGQVIFVVCSMVKNRFNRIYYFSETCCVEFGKIIAFYYLIAIALASIPIIAMCMVLCLVGGGGGRGDCGPGPSDAISWNGLANGNPCRGSSVSRRRCERKEGEIV